MRKHFYRSMTGLALALTTVAACASTVTFDSLPRHRAATDLGTTVDIGGFTFASSSDLYAPGRRDRADPHGQTLAVPEFEQGLFVVPDNSAPFTLVSFDLGSLPLKGGSEGDDKHERGHHGGGDVGSFGPIELVYMLDSSPDVQSILLTLDGAPGLQTFELGLQDVIGFGLLGVPFQFDNLVTTTGGSTPAVPEPNSLAVLLAGLALLASMARRLGA